MADTIPNPDVTVRYKRGRRSRGTTGDNHKRLPRPSWLFSPMNLRGQSWTNENIVGRLLDEKALIGRSFVVEDDDEAEGVIEAMRKGGMVVYGIGVEIGT